MKGKRRKGRGGKNSRNTPSVNSCLRPCSRENCFHTFPGF